MEKWLDPELWLRGGGIAALMLVSLVLSIAYGGRVIFLWIQPQVDAWIKAHVTHVEASVKNNERLTTAVETLSDTVGDLCPRIHAIAEAQRQGCEAISKTIKDPEVRASVEPHLTQIRDVLRLQPVQPQKRPQTT